MLSSRLWLVLAILLLTTMIAGCGQAGPIPAAQRDSQLIWPPDESLARTASDDAPYFKGKEYAAAGGGKTQVSGSGVVLGPNQKPSWAIYSLQGFGPTTDLDKVEIDYTVTLGSPDQNTKLYFGIANYGSETWEWLDVTGSPVATIDLPDFTGYYSPSGSIHLACILTGNGSARINSLRFYRTGAGAEVPVPANVAATPIPGTVQLVWDAVPYIDGYTVYRNTVNDFATAVKRTPVLISANDFDDATVVKDTDYFYWVTATRLVEGAPSAPASVHSIDTTVAVPQNLQGTPDVGSAHLSWDPVSNAIAYKLYRSRYVDFGSETETLVLGTSYDDLNIPKAQVYYYRVLAVGEVEESPKSPGINMFIPEVNLPAPTNFQVDAAHTDGDFVTFTWDYDPDPAQFDIYIHRVPNFPLDAELIAPNILRAGDQRNAMRFELPAEGGTYYARICARDAGAKMGFMTDSISFTNHPYFVFAPQEDIAASVSTPIATALGGSELAVAYMSGNAVKLAAKSSGNWSADESTGLNSNFGNYLDIAYGGGEYCIGAFQTINGDCHVSIGTHGGSWAASRIHGDGSSGPGHEVSGVNLAVTASDTEFAVTHNITADPLPFVVQTRLISGGAWNTSTPFTLAAPSSNMSMAFTATDLMLCASDYAAGNLLMGSRSGGYSMSPVNVTPGDFVCQYNALDLVNGNLVTPCVDQNTSQLYSYRFDGSAWQRDDVFAPTSTVSHLDMATYQDKAFVVYLCPPQSRWYCAYFDGIEWRNSSLVTLGGSSIQTEAKPMFLPTGEPYLVFIDATNGLHGAQGNLL